MKITNIQALQMNMSLFHLIKLRLPISVSLEIAKLHKEVEKRVKTFNSERDNLIKEYQIKVMSGDESGEVKFTVVGNKAEVQDDTVNEFVAKVDRLAGEEAEDLDMQIHLPSNIMITPDILEPLLGVVVIDD